MLYPVVARLYRNVGILFTGNIISSLLGLVSLAILTRALSLEIFGIYTLIIALVHILDRLTSFQTWQALIHFGSHALEQNDKKQLTSLFLFGWLLDIASGFVGFGMALAITIWLPGMFNLNEATLLPVAIATSVLLFNWLSSSTAIMRLFDRYYAQAIYQNITAILSLTSVIFLWYSDTTNLLPYLAAFAISRIIGQLTFAGLSIQEAINQGIWSADQINLKHMFQKSPKLWRFVFTTNLDGMVRVVREIDVFVVNALLGPTFVALYKIARSLTSAVGKLTGPFYQASYPELARFIAQKDYIGMTKMMKHTSLSLGAFVTLSWLLFLIFGPFILPTIFGPAYASAYPVTLACMSAMVIWAFAQPLSPAMMALGKVGSLLVIHIITTVLYIIMLAVASKYFGLLGAGISLTIFYFLWSGSALFSFMKSIKSLT